MRTRILIVVALVLAGLLAWLLASTEPRPRDQAATAARDARMRATPSEDATRGEDARTAGTESRNAREGLDAPGELGATESREALRAGRRALVTGRVVDERGAALAGATLRLHTQGAEWSSGVAVPTVKSGARNVPGFRTTSDSDGRFAFDVPLPAAERTWLTVSPDEYHLSARRQLGSGGGGGEEPRIAVGQNELREIVLAAAGVVHGRVLAEGGRPLPGAEVRVGIQHARGPSSPAVTGDDGSFRLPHVPPGALKFSVVRKGYLSVFDAPVAVLAGADARLADVVLAPAPSVSGIVVDQHGTPVPDVWVSGTPEGGGYGVRADSGADGRFEMWLQEAGPYRLAVRMDRRFRKWGDKPSAGNLVKPGATDVRIVLQRIGIVRFRVLDAATGAPVERFALAIDELTQGSSTLTRFSRLSAPRDHAAGECEVPARPGVDAVGIVAAGYAPLQAEVAPVAGDPPVQVLRLVRGGALAGRVTRSGSSSQGVEVVLVGREMQGFEPRMLDLGDLAGRWRITATGEDGTFRFEDLAVGTYRLTVKAGGGAPKTLSSVVVPSPAAVDVGTIALEAGATLLGRIVAGPGESPRGFGVRLKSSAQEPSTVERADGSFTFDGLPAGEHELYWWRPHDAQNSLAWRSEVVTLAAGEVRELVIDANASAPCQVVVRLAHPDGRPLAGWEVQWIACDERGRARRDGQLLGISDADGVVRGVLEGGQPVRFAARMPGLFEGGRSQEPARTIGGETVEAKLVLRTGGLVVQLPSDSWLLPGGTLAATMQSADPDVASGGRAAPMTRVERVRRARDVGAWDGWRWDAGQVAEGEYQLTLAVPRKEADAEGSGPAGSDRLPRSFTTRVTIRAGETTEVRVP